MQEFLVAERHQLRRELRERDAAAVTAPAQRRGEGDCGSGTSGHLAEAQQLQAQAPRSGGGDGAGLSSGSNNWQKKGGTSAATQDGAAVGPWGAALGTAALLANASDSASAGFEGDALESELAAVAAEAADAAAAASTAAGYGARQQLVVVASLLSKVPNLAGLARTCEVFG